MASDKLSNRIDRRTVIKTAALAGVAQIASPFVVTSWAADEVKIGLDNPLTGTYAAVGKNELIGCQLAIEQINAKGGILGRKAELLVEDSTSGDAATAVQKARKLIDRDKINFLLGNVNSALAMAMAGVSSEKGVLHVVPGGHTDAVTGTIVPLERVPRLQHDADGSERRGRHVDQGLRQEVVLHHARLRLRPHA